MCDISIHLGGPGPAVPRGVTRSRICGLLPHALETATAVVKRYHTLFYVSMWSLRVLIGLCVVALSVGHGETSGIQPLPPHTDAPVGHVEIEVFPGDDVETLVVEQCANHGVEASACHAFLRSVLGADSGASRVRAACLCTPAATPRVASHAQAHMYLQAQLETILLPYKRTFDAAVVTINGDERVLQLELGDDPWIATQRWCTVWRMPSAKCNALEQVVTTAAVEEW